ncbi:MAG: restriction endonuclease subunit S [Calditrichaeota bacterium]|nr:MAG: restriction endonuclease subunit S [Calditrichota bacterium]
MKKGWEIKKLGEVCQFQGGSQPPKSEFIYEPRENYVRFLQIRDFKSNKHLTFIPESTKNRYCNESDILLGRYGASVGKVLVEKKGAYNVAVMKSIPNEEILNKRYLYFYFNSVDFQKRLKNVASRSAQNGFSKNDIFNFPILIPPLSEQKRIVEILDKVFSAIDKAKANAEQNLKNAKELFESYLNGIFENKSGDWEEKKLGEVCRIISKLIDPKKPQYQNFLHIGAGNIESKKGTIKKLKTAKEENIISGKFLFDERMVLYSKIRPNLMKIVKCDFEGLCSADIYPLSPINKEITQSFLYYLFFTIKFTEYAIEGSQRAGMPKVNRNHLFKYSFYCPSIQRQQKIVEKLESLSAETKKLESIYQKKIEDFEELKKSILQKAFNGEL